MNQNNTLFKKKFNGLGFWNFFPFIPGIHRGCQDALEVAHCNISSVVRQILLLQCSYEILLKFLF